MGESQEARIGGLKTCQETGGGLRCGCLIWCMIEALLPDQEVAEEPKKLGPDALLRQKVKQKRFRDGYEEGLSTTHKAASAAAFIASEQPVEMLGQHSRSVSAHPARLCTCCPH